MPGTALVRILFMVFIMFTDIFISSVYELKSRGTKYDVYVFAQLDRFATLTAGSARNGCVGTGFQISPWQWPCKLWRKTKHIDRNDSKVYAMQYFGPWYKRPQQMYDEDRYVLPAKRHLVLEGRHLVNVLIPDFQAPYKLH